MDWFIHLRSPKDIWELHPTYLLSECNCLFVAGVTLMHSFIVGGRWKYLWMGALLHGAVTEMVLVALPDLNNCWHAQSTVMLLGKRLPLHRLLIYPALMYIAAYAVAHLKLPRWAEPLAAGLTEVLLHLPYNLLAVKFVHWSWHDTDPNISDRHYHVPWNSYYFHLSFGVSFTVALHFWRRMVTGHDDKGTTSTVWKEFVCAGLSGLCGLPGGVLQFVLLYHPIHETHGVHTENCFFIVLLLSLLVIWTADRSPVLTSRRQKGEFSHWSVYLIVVAVMMHYSLYLNMAVYGHPEQEVSIGLHQTVGPCNETSEFYSAFGKVLQKRTYLCISDYAEPYFDFQCVAGQTPPAEGSSWYTICGTRFLNRVEYITMITAICTLAVIVLRNVLFSSAPTMVCMKRKKE